MTPPIVIVPHVDWRRLALLQLLEQLSKQTLQPRVIVLHDAPDEVDGRSRLDQTTQRFLRTPPWWPEDLLGGVTPTDSTRAQCERWRLIEEIAAHDKARGVRSSEDGVLVLTLDDDMVIDPRYVARTVAHFYNLRDSLIDRGGEDALDPILSWGGVDTTYTWRHYYDEHGAHELIVPQAGCMCFYADTFTGIGDTLLAERGHVRGGSEEVPVAAFVHKKRWKIFRPAGIGPTPHVLAFDPRSSFKTTQAQLHELLRYADANELWPHAKAMLQLLTGKRPAPYKNGEAR